MKKSVLFVCLGNICRSPLAEGALRAEASRHRLDITIGSAGTGTWHIGHPPDARARWIADSNGVDIAELRARQIGERDFSDWDMIVAMDRSVFDHLRRMQPARSRAKLSLFLDHVPGREGQDVADPYHGDDDGFALTWADAVAGAEQIACKLQPSG